MTWMLFSRSNYAGGGPRHGPPHPPTLGAPPGTRGTPRSPALGSAPGNPRHSSTCSLPDPLHVAVDGYFAHRHDLAALDQDEPGAIGRPMVFARIGEGRGDAPRVELVQGLQRFLDRLAGQRVARALDGLARHD